LNDEGMGPHYVSREQPEAGLCAVVMKVERARLQLHRLQKMLDRRGQVPEAVFVALMIRHGAQSEAGQIRRHEVPTVRERGQQMAKLDRR
jgi:hypothetical protein